MITDWGIFENSQITLFPCLTFIYKTGCVLPHSTLSNVHLKQVWGYVKQVVFSVNPAR